MTILQGVGRSFRHSLLFNERLCQCEQSPAFQRRLKFGEGIEKGTPAHIIGSGPVEEFSYRQL